MSCCIFCHLLLAFCNLCALFHFRAFIVIFCRTKFTFVGERATLHCKTEKKDLRLSPLGDRSNGLAAPIECVAFQSYNPTGLVDHVPIVAFPVVLYDC